MSAHARRPRSASCGTAPVEPLIAAVGDANAEVRRRSARALGEIADARALHALTARLKDQDPGVRRAAVQAIAEIRRRTGHLRTSRRTPPDAEPQPKSESEPQSEPRPRGAVPEH